MNDSTVINDISFGLIIWQIVALVFILCLIYFVFKFYKKLNKYHDIKMRELKNQK